jgi:DNA-directed RNA polymerase specialized sigma24 family protein
MSAVLDPLSPILPDSTLLDRVVRRDSTALIELERRHWSSLYAQVYSMLVDATLAEWVVRETFTHLWYAAGQFVGTRTASSWLRRRAKELAWAELALRDREYSTAVRRIDEENSTPRARVVGADLAHRADTGAEPPCIGHGERESGNSHGTPGNESAW